MTDKQQTKPNLLKQYIETVLSRREVVLRMDELTRDKQPVGEEKAETARLTLKLMSLTTELKELPPEELMKMTENIDELLAENNMSIKDGDLSMLFKLTQRLSALGIAMSMIDEIRQYEEKGASDEEIEALKDRGLQIIAEKLGIDREQVDMVKENSIDKWMPSGGKHTIIKAGVVKESSQDNDDINLVDFGMCFSSHEDAKKAHNKYFDMHRLYKLQQYLDDGWSPDPNFPESGWTLNWANEESGKTLAVAELPEGMVPIGGVVFRTEESAIKAVTHINKGGVLIA